MIKETIKKFDDFFYYAMDAKNLKLGSPEKQCELDSQCGAEGEDTKCCVSAVFRNKENEKQHEMFRCMNKAVVFANMDMKMNDHSISMRCQKSTGAAYMAATFAASAATLAAYTLYWAPRDELTAPSSFFEYFKPLNMDKVNKLRT